MGVASAGTWQSVGVGDCPGRDVSGSRGPKPEAAKCDASFAGNTAVCWATGCTYKSVATAACTGGANPGQMYTCVAAAAPAPASSGWQPMGVGDCPGRDVAGSRGPVPEPGKLPFANTHVVTPDYFRAMGIPLLRGELFSSREPAPTFPAGELLSMDLLPKIYKDFDVACVISQRMADQIWPGEDPIGKRFQFGFPEMQLPKALVIGVVGSTTQTGLARGESAEYYCLLKQYPAPMSLHLVVRTRADPGSVLASVRTAVHAVVPDEPIYDVELMTSRIAGFSSDRRFNMGLFSFFAATALLLAVVGIYGVLACVVGQRTREVGIRMALGAQRRDVLCDVLFRGMRLALPGVLAGLAGAWAVSRLLQSQLFGVTGTDPLAYAGSALLLLLAAVLACYVPARRATQISPIEALRAE